MDIVVVLRISTRWTPVLARAGSIPSFASMRLGCQVMFSQNFLLGTILYLRTYLDIVSLSCVSTGVDLVWRKFPTKIKIVRN